MLQVPPAPGSGTILRTEGISRKMGEPTPTSYALLALLSLRPWSAYELTGFMRTSNVRGIWPRAESRLYAEPKNLVKQGLVSATIEKRGDRKRTVYRISPKGRRELGTWLKQPSKRFVYESEAMLKVSFGDMTDLDQLVRTIEEIRAEAEDDLGVARKAFANRLNDGVPFSERVHVNALVAQFCLEMMEARLRWASFAEDFIRDWESSEGDEEKTEQGVEWFRRALERLSSRG
jgi:PadR family transcriptional regulator AphA